MQEVVPLLAFSQPLGVDISHKHVLMQHPTTLETIAKGVKTFATLTGTYQKEREFKYPYYLLKCKRLDKLERLKKLLAG